MSDFFADFFSFFLSELLYYLQEKHRILYVFIMGCMIVLFAGIAVVFYLSGAPVKGTVLLVFALLILVLLAYSLHQNRKPSRRSWNSWFDKRR